MNTFKTFRSSKQSEQANVSLIFAILVVPLLISVGVAIDYSRMSSAHNKLQNTADAAALSGALAFMQQGEDGMETSGENAHNLHTQDIDKLQMKNLMIAKTDHGTVYVESKAKLEPLFMQAFGYPKLDLTVTSEATTKAPRGLEIALAFDSTFSINFDSRRDAAISTVKNTT